MRFETMKYLRSIRWRMFDLRFYKKHHDFCDAENAKHWREAHFENRKCENTLRIPLLMKNRMFIFYCNLYKTVKKKPVGFPSKLHFRNVRNWKFFLDARRLEKEACKNAYKTFVFLMISNLDVSFMKIRCCKNCMIFMILS